MGQAKIWNGSSWVSHHPKVWNGSAWVGIPKFWDGTQWVNLAGEQVSAVANGCTNSVISGTCYGGPIFLNTGAEQEYTSTGGTVSQGNWLDAGSASNVWVVWHRTGGTLSDWNSLGGGNNGVRLNLGTSRNFRISRAAQGISTLIGYFEFWDAASGGNLLQTTSTVTWLVEQGNA